MTDKAIDKDSERYLSGLKGEELAIIYFERLGFCLVDRRFKTKEGEIDVVMADKNKKIIVFVEVKRRKKIYDYENVITKQQWNRIYNASIEFLRLQSPKYDNYDIRYDAFICFVNSSNTFHIENILTTDNKIE